MQTNKEVLSIVRKYVGPVFAGMIVRNDVVYVQVVKSNLLDVLKDMADGQVTVTERHGALYIDN